MCDLEAQEGGKEMWDAATWQRRVDRGLEDVFRANNGGLEDDEVTPLRAAIANGNVAIVK